MVGHPQPPLVLRLTLPRPPHPAPRIVTIASRPSQWDGMDRNVYLLRLDVKDFMAANVFWFDKSYLRI
jgi:hypothetical protein